MRQSKFSLYERWILGIYILEQSIKVKQIGPFELTVPEFGHIRPCGGQTGFGDKQPQLDTYRAREWKITSSVNWRSLTVFRGKFPCWRNQMAKVVKMSVRTDFPTANFDDSKKIPITSEGIESYFMIVIIWRLFI